MTNEVIHKAPVSLAQRKEKLIREGASYRAAVRGSRDVVSHNLHAEVLARSVISHLTSSAYSAVGNLLNIKGANLQTLLPVAVSGVTFIIKARLLLPLLRAAVIVGAVGGAAYFLLRHKEGAIDEQ
jgi:hypothetical protein